MTAMLKPSHDNQPMPPRHLVAIRSAAASPFSTPPARSRAERQKLVSLTSGQILPNSSATVRSLPNRQTLPVWLQLLLRLHKTSRVVTFLLVISTLAVYSWTVHSQQLWGRDYQRLDKLLEQERSLATAIGSLKTQVAKQAGDPQSNLRSPNPSNTVFLSQVAQRPSRQSASTNPLPPEALGRPSGY